VGFNKFALELKSNINSFYLNYLFLNVPTQYFSKSLAKPAVHQVSFSSKDLLKMNIPPPPIKEQEKIIDILLKLDELIEAKKSENVKSKQIKKALKLSSKKILCL
jgi:type I restriction enzyme, S subunit